MDEAAALARACELARRGRWNVEPNPTVGCVLLRDGAVVGEGWHRAYGGPHAEVEALRDAGAAARGATAVVTLEPCSTRGKTGACTDALLAAGVRRVVAGAVDPNPAHAGAGLELLRAQGLDVELREGDEGDEAAALLGDFRRQLTRRRPWVLAKWAQSVDGCVARRGPDGAPEPVSLSGEAARAWLHRQRAHLDGVLVGVGTLLADDPQLTARGVDRVRPLRRLVLDPSLRASSTSRLVSTAGEHPTWLLCSEDASTEREETLRAQGCSIFRLPHADDLLPAALACLHMQGLGRVMVEGGPTTHARLLDAGLADAVAVVLCGAELGRDGLPALPGERLPADPEALAARLELTPWELRELGEDRLLLGNRPG